MRLPRSTLRRLGYLGILYLVGLVVMVPLFGTSAGTAQPPLDPAAVVIAFVFELMDSSAGMGFGTALAPTLFVLGYSPLEVTPVLLISKSITGIVAGGVPHEFENVSFSIRPLNDEARIVLLLGSVGAVASVVSIVLTYFTLSVPENDIKIYRTPGRVP